MIVVGPTITWLTAHHLASATWVPQPREEHFELAPISVLIRPNNYWRKLDSVELIGNRQRLVKSPFISDSQPLDQVNYVLFRDDSDSFGAPHRWRCHPIRRAQLFATFWRHRLLGGLQGANFWRNPPKWRFRHCHLPAWRCIYIASWAQGNFMRLRISPV